MADINALLAQAASSVSEVDPTSTLSECDVSGLQIELRTDDADLTAYNARNQNDAPDVHAMQGFGDKAYWAALSSGSGTAQSTPSVLVHKGSATCSLFTNNDPSTLSLPYTPTPPPFGIKSADCDAWAQKAGKVCVEYLAAAGF